MLCSQKFRKKENLRNTKFYINSPRYAQKGPNLQEIFLKWENIVEAASITSSSTSLLLLLSTLYLTKKRGQSIVKETQFLQESQNFAPKGED